MADGDSSQVKAAKIAAAATIGAALIGLLAVLIPRIGDDGSSNREGPIATPTKIPTGLPGSGSASVFLNTKSGAGGSTINVSGSGFAANEEVVITMSTQEIGRTTTNDEGKFANVAVTVPSSLSVFAPQQFDVVARGRTSFRFDSTPFTVSG